MGIICFIANQKKNPCFCSSCTLDVLRGLLSCSNIQFWVETVRQCPCSMWVNVGDKNKQHLEYVSPILSSMQYISDARGVQNLFPTTSFHNLLLPGTNNPSRVEKCYFSRVKEAADGCSRLFWMWFDSHLSKQWEVCFVCSQIKDNVYGQHARIEPTIVPKGMALEAW